MDRDENANLEDHDLNQHQNASSSQTTKRKGRGPAKSIKAPEPMFLEFDEIYFPTGKWQKHYGQQLGYCATKLDINLRDWGDVAQDTKDMLWEDTKKKFHIKEDQNGKRKSNFLRALATRFRRRKSWLVSRFVEKTTGPAKDSPDSNKLPWEACEGQFTQDQWKIFEAYVSSDEFKEKSRKGKENAKRNIHRHTSGQKGYSRRRPEWIKEKRLPVSSDGTSEGSSGVVNETSIQNRALEWCLAHQRRLTDGKWEVNPNKPETAQIVDQVMEHIKIEAKEKEEGGTPSDRGVDALTKALGKKDHRGYVKGFGRYGVGVGHQQAFGKLAGKSKRATPGYEEVEALKASLIEEFDLKQARMEKELEKKFQQRLQERVTMEVQTYLASLSPLNMTIGSSLGLPTPPQEPPIEVTKCRLAVHDEENEGNLVIVVEGQVYPDLGPHVHNSSLLSGHYRVSVDSPYEEHWSVLVPVPDGDNVTTVGAAKDCLLQWPKSLVLFADKISS